MLQKPQAIEEQNGKRKTEFEIYFCYLKLEDPRSSEFGLGDIIFFLNIYISGEDYAQRRYNAS